MPLLVTPLLVTPHPVTQRHAVTALGVGCPYFSPKVMQITDQIA
jgi:hypothetical protein